METVTSVRRFKWAERLRRVPPVVWALLTLVIVFGLAEPRFFTLSNLVNILRQGSVLVILCMGILAARIAGGVDLSVGGVLTFAGMMMAVALSEWKMPIPVALLIAVVVGTLCGLLNGIFVARMHVPSFIATLGVQGMAFGASLGMRNGNPVGDFPRAVRFFGWGEILGIATPIWIAAIAFVLTHVLLNHTQFGVYIYALGGNEDALVLAGKPAWLYTLLAFTYAGFCAGLAAIVMTARNMAAQATVGTGLEFQALSGAILGGTFVAGRGGALDTLLGVMFILVLRNGLNVVGVPPIYQVPIFGATLVTAIIVSLVLERRSRRLI